MKKNIIISSFVAITAVIVGIIAWLPTTQAQSIASYDVSGYAFSDMPNSADQQITATNNYGGRGLGKIEMSGADYQVKLSSTGQFSGYAWNGFGGYASFGGVSVQSACLANPDSICDVTGDFVFIAARNAPVNVSGGWDGIVRTNGAWDKPVKLGKAVNGVRTMSGFAWGGDVVGWVDFSNVTVAVGILGCTDSTATNYNENATIDDGSCLTGSTFDICTNIDGDQSEVPPNHTKDPATPGVPGVCSPIRLCPNGSPIPPNGICLDQCTSTSSTYNPVTGECGLCVPESYGYDPITGECSGPGTPPGDKKNPIYIEA
jgi:hypothetical protein